VKVLIFGECPYIPSSFGKVTYYIASGLADAGHRVAVSCPAGTTTLFSKGLVWRPSDSCINVAEDNKDIYCERRLSGRPIVVYPHPPADDVKRFVRDVFQPDVVLVYGTPYTPLTNAVLKELAHEIPVAGYFVSESLILPPAYTLQASNATVFASPTVFTMKTFTSSLRVDWGIPDSVLSDRVRVIPHGIDLDFYSRENAENVTPALEHTSFTFGFFAKNHIRKDVAVLLRAYADMHVSLIDRSRLFIALVKGAGGDDYWKLDVLTQTAAIEAGLETDYLLSHVFFLDDFTSGMGLTEWQVLRIYLSLDAFVFPSAGESFGLPPLEAAALGIPLIVSDHPALREVWGEVLPKDLIVPVTPYLVNEALMLVKPDVHALTSAMSLLMLNDKLREEVAERVRSHALNYPLSLMVSGIEKLLKLAINIGPEPISSRGKK